MRRSGRLRRLERYGLVGGALAAAALAAPAVAQELPENNSGTGQYIEPVPDAAGDRPAAPGAGGGGGGPSSGSGGGSLPPSARDALPAGEEGQVLERIATDPGSGAPSGSGRERGRGGGSRGDRDEIPAADDEGAISALASAATGDDGPALPLILLGALGLTLAAAGWRLRAGGA